MMIIDLIIIIWWWDQQKAAEQKLTQADTTAESDHVEDVEKKK